MYVYLYIYISISLSLYLSLSLYIYIYIYIDRDVPGWRYGHFSYQDPTNQEPFSLNSENAAPLVRHEDYRLFVGPAWRTRPEEYSEDRFYTPPPPPRGGGV